jgi:hypothetical protein
MNTPDQPNKSDTPSTAAVISSVGKSNPVGFTGILVILILVLVIIFLYNYGAARLAYCAFSRMGYGDGFAFIMSIIAWLFSGLYYPIHALFITTECSAPKLAGGRRKN